MKNFIIASIALIFTTILLSSCSNKDMGMVTGGVLGGVAGSALTQGSTAGTVVGAVGGGYLGRQIAN